MLSSSGVGVSTEHSLGGELARSAQPRGRHSHAAGAAKRRATSNKRILVE
jgi:hypothetical protein